MNQVSFGNGVPTRTQVAVHSVGAQSTDGESSEAVAASDTMTQSAAEMGYAQDAGQMSATAKRTSTEKQAASVEISEEGWNAMEDYNQSAIEYSMQLLERLKESRQNSKSTNTKTTKQPVNYSFRKVSAAIARAKNVNQASNALTSASSALSALRRKSASGQYNDDELQIAINHAKKMVRVARKKVQNIRRESQMESDDKGTVHRKQNETGQKIVRRRKKADEKEDALQELQLLKKQMKTRREQEKYSHRRHEGQNLMSADMEYLQKMIRLLKNEGFGTVNNTVDATVVDVQAGMAGMTGAGDITMETTASTEVSGCFTCQDTL
jgi:chromosome segregation ATPase